jgi:hypothetical protein
MAIGVQRTGDWALARRLIGGSARRIERAIETATRQEAHVLRSDIILGLTKQAPGGVPIRPLAKTTLAARQLKGFAGTKALLRRGDLRGAIAVITEGAKVFVGVSRKARRDGGSMVDVARVQEFGAGPFVVPITPKMRRFLFVLFKRVGAQLATRSRGEGVGVVVIKIPARPFLQPAFKQYQRGAQGRFLGRVAKLSGLGV